MQPTEGFSVQRRAMDVEDYIDVVRRHKGWIFGPFLFTLVASVVGVYMWPDSYESQAVIKIVPQRVPAKMVESAINQEMVDRINSMSQTIRSRTVLTTIINTFNLYARERGRLPIEDVIEQMNQKIIVQPVATLTSGRQVPAFIVQFSYEDRYQAQKVVQDLVARFIEENTRNRSDATFMTTQFLKDQVDMAKKDLDAIESKLTEFRVANNGRLPDQVDANMRQLQALQANVTYLANAISRAQQEKLQMETNVRIFKDQIAALSREPQEAPVVVQVRKSDRLIDAEREISNLENSLAVLRKQYTDKNPDVVNVSGRLALAKQRKETILKEEAQEKKEEPPAPKGPNQQTQKELRDLDANVRRMESAIEAKDLEISDQNKELKRTNDAIKSYQGRIETVPVGERQYGDLVREREMAKVKYVELQERLGKAELAKDMEDRKQGETLELLDPASLPLYPTEPKRPIIISLGAALGLIMGVVIAGAREMKDTSLKNLKDVRAYTQMAILGSIPLLENDFVVRRRRRLAWLGWTTASLASAVTMAGAIVYYYISKK
jgi:polysaccharide chain length determinant protein (PEP-CTERM system associated)